MVWEVQARPHIALNQKYAPIFNTSLKASTESRVEGTTDASSGQTTGRKDGRRSQSSHGMVTCTQPSKWRDEHHPVWIIPSISQMATRLARCTSIMCLCPSYSLEYQP